jgi:hypothetical protein
VDDCSTDETYNIAKEIELIDRRIKVCRNENNLGQFPYQDLNNVALHIPKGWRNRENKLNLR